MSSAVAEAPAKPRLIQHPQDAALLKGYGADLEEQALRDEYFEFRDLTSQGPGPLEQAILKTLVVAQKRRKAKVARTGKKDS